MKCVKPGYIEVNVTIHKDSERKGKERKEAQPPPAQWGSAGGKTKTN